MAGLFDYQSPENMRAARLDPLLVSQAQMGQQSLLNRLVSQMSNAGANLGSAGAGMLGLELPEEAKQNSIKQVMQQVSNIASPLGQAQAAYQLFTDKGMTEEAQKTMGSIRDLQKEELSQDILRSKMETDRLKATKPSASKEFLQITDFLSELDATLASGIQPSPSDLNKARLYLGKLSKSPKVYTDRETLEQITIPGYDASNSVPALSALLNNRPMPQGSGQPSTQPQGTQPVNGQPSTQPQGTQQQGMIVNATPGSRKLLAKEIESLDATISRMEQAQTLTTEATAILDEGSFQTSPAGYKMIEGGVPDMLSGFAGSFQSLKTKVDTLKSMKVIDTIQMMKAQSQTGATGFGALNATELQRLEDDYIALKPESPTFKTDLATWNKRLGAAITKLKAKMEEARGGATPAANSENVNSNKGTKDQWMAWGRTNLKGMSEAQIEAALRAKGKF